MLSIVPCSFLLRGCRVHLWRGANLSTEELRKQTRGPGAVAAAAAGTPARRSRDAFPDTTASPRSARSGPRSPGGRSEERGLLPARQQKVTVTAPALATMMMMRALYGTAALLETRARCTSRHAVNSLISPAAGGSKAQCPRSGAELETTSSGSPQRCAILRKPAWKPSELSNETALNAALKIVGSATLCCSVH
ncbi:hypothetical protein AAFF_G00217910 [Aldrovandia affinis]|uniref:Uncharacterized protein n=1 Tax=Aldrovandia affinis TaxID=143900 RepID=A0AAD7SX39_9TELE|nr:hypothetical protein AAFF_G00217910 [Aldrovandia affinis]